MKNKLLDVKSAGKALLVAYALMSAVPVQAMMRRIAAHKNKIAGALFTTGVLGGVASTIDKREKFSAEVSSRLPNTTSPAKWATKNSNGAVARVVDFLAPLRKEVEQPVLVHETEKRQSFREKIQETVKHVQSLSKDAQKAYMEENFEEMDAISVYGAIYSLHEDIRSEWVNRALKRSGFHATALAFYSFLPEDQRKKWALEILEEHDVSQQNAHDIHEKLKGIAYISFDHLPEETRRKWYKNSLETRPELETLTTPLTISGLGPLFSGFHLDHQQFAHEILPPSKSCENFNALLWDIAEYAQLEYEKGRQVYFHACSSRPWPLLEKFFRTLYDIKHTTHTREDFIWLRYHETSPIPSQKVAELRKNGSLWLPAELLEDNEENLVLFTTLHPFANSAGANPYRFATQNRDQTSPKEPNSCQTRLEDIFTELGFSAEFQELTRQREGKIPFIEELVSLYLQAIEDQGNFGRLLVISMPSEEAERLSYLTCITGMPFAAEIKKGKTTEEIYKTTSTVELSKHFSQSPFWNECCLILGPEFYDPTNTALKIVGFDPAMYQRTEKYRAFEAKFEEAMTMVKNSYEKRVGKAQA